MRTDTRSLSTSRAAMKVGVRDLLILPERYKLCDYCARQGALGKGGNIMSRRLSRSMATALIAIALGVMAVAAMPASATLTPPLSALTASSSNADWTRAGFGTRCPTNTFRGTIAADGLSASGEFALSNNGRPTCPGRLGCEVTTAGGSPTTITLRSTASARGVSATFDLVFDANFTLNFSCLGGTNNCTISGPQTIRGAGILTQGTPSRLATNMRIRCAEAGGRMEQTGTYTFVERLTIS